MTLELRDIPPAPRQVRWSAVVWRRFPLCLAGSVLLVFGGVVTLLLWIAPANSHHAEAERRLDAAAVVGDGVATAVAPVDGGREGWEHVRYRFTPPAAPEQDGESLVRAGQVRAGEPLEIEFVADAPHLSRALGGELVHQVTWHRIALWTTVAPGALLLVAWLAGVLALRQVLRRGDAAIAEPFEVRRRGLALPTMLEVRFRFRDRHAQVREGRHWLRARSVLGERLSALAERPPASEPRVLWRPGRRVARAAATDWWTVRAGDLPRLVVVHDRDHPERHGLVAAADFEPQVRPPHALPPRAWLG